MKLTPDMTAPVPSLPLPVGARLSSPRRLTATWAPPRASDLVLDPWSAPVGQPIARSTVSPWPAPDASMRILSMPPPVALTALPDMSRTSTNIRTNIRTNTPTIATPRSPLLVPPSGEGPVVRLDLPVPESIRKVGHIDPIRPAAASGAAPARDASTPSRTLIAMIAALAGVATAVVALVANAL